MDYPSRPLSFKIRKILRYTRMYGVRRTCVKVQGQRHMRRRFAELPKASRPIKRSQAVGLIGCGNYAFTNIAYFLTRRCGAVIGACMDKDIHRAASLGRGYSVPFFTDRADELLANDTIRIVFVASNHASHADYAVRALEQGKDVYIEKPHVVSWEQLDRLIDAMDRCPGRVYLGFNRPNSRIGKRIREALDREAGAGVYNWFVAGHYLAPDHWYNLPEEGGRVFGNLCHWTDFLYMIVGPGGLPAEIVPVRGDSNDVDIVVSYKFQDQSLGVISFSAKAELFEGISERFTAQKGDCLVSMDDFWQYTLQVGARKQRHRNIFRDHGHEDNIVGAYKNSTKRLSYDRLENRTRIANTAVLYLKTKEALDRNERVFVGPYGHENGKPDR